MATSSACSVINTLLTAIGLLHLLQKIPRKKVDVNNIIYATDNDLIKLGVTTIGDMARLREGCRKHIQKQQNNSTINIHRKHFPNFGPKNVQISGSVNIRVPRNYVPTNRKCRFSANLFFLYKY